MEGWVKIHRKICAWEWYTDPNTSHLFIYLLLNANYALSRWQGIDVPRGSIVTGRKSLSEKTGISEQSIRTSLERLKSTNEITSTIHNKFSLITITNYESYQEINQISNHEVTSNQPAINQQVTTSKESKKIRKEEKKEREDGNSISEFALTPTVENFKLKIRATRLTEDWKLPSEWGEWAEEQGLDRSAILLEQEKFRDHWISTPGGKACKANWQATWRNWIRRHLERKIA